LDSAGWEMVPVGDVVTLTRDPVKVVSTDDYPNLGIYSFGRGAFPKPPIKGIATSAQTLFRVRAGQFIYSRLFAFEGAFAVVPNEMDGFFVSNEYPAFDIDLSRILTDYLRIAICRPAAWHEMAGMTVGMGHRRQRLQPDAFLTHEIALPSLGEQRRIASALNAIDHTVGAYALERDAALGLLRAAREELLSGLETRRLGDLLERIEAGKSPKALDRPPVEGERGVLKVSAIRAGEFRPGESKAVDDSIDFPDRARVQSGDVLISRANTRLLVGATCRVERAFPNLYLCDKTLRLVPQPELDPNFLVHAITTSVAREQIEEAATGTSDSMKNISQSVILELDIPVAETLERQRELASELNNLHRGALDAQALHHRTNEMRAALVEALLSGQRRISETLAA
jgi:type I restriction enzyme S subunit